VTVRLVHSALRLPTPDSRLPIRFESVRP
jgi:hypothetical protein